MTGRRSSPRSAVPAVPDGFCGCPVDVAFDVFGRKWTMLLIRNMLRGQRRFNEFLANIEGINPKILSTRLKELEQERIILRRVAQRSPVTVEYELTEKGFAALPILRQMVRWSVAFEPERVLGNGFSSQEIERCVDAWMSGLVANEVAFPAVDRKKRT